MDYKVVYSTRRTLGIQIKNCKIIVRSPYGVTREQIEKSLLSHSSWIERKMAEQEKKINNTQELSEDQIKSLRKNARQILTEKVAHYSKIMGLEYGRITITGAKTRFGSCTSKGNISFSYRLMLYPEAAVDYVVVHELSHLVEMNHSKRFYKVVEKVLPDYKERRKLLK